MNDLDIYMLIWLNKQLCPSLTPKTLTAMIKDMNTENPSPRDINEVASGTLLSGKLPTSYMMCYWLYNKGFSQKAISQLLGISPSAVSQNVTRGEENAKKAHDERKRYINNALQNRRNEIKKYNLQESRKNSATHNW